MVPSTGIYYQPRKNMLFLRDPIGVLEFSMNEAPMGFEFSLM